MKKYFLNLLFLLVLFTAVCTPNFVNATAQEKSESSFTQSISEKLDAMEKKEATEPEDNSLSIINFINSRSDYVVGIFLIAALLVMFYPKKAG